VLSDRGIIGCFQRHLQNVEEQRRRKFTAHVARHDMHQVNLKGSKSSVPGGRAPDPSGRLPSSAKPKPYDKEAYDGPSEASPGIRAEDSTQKGGIRKLKKPV
jgi:hypothetical protein